MSDPPFWDCPDCGGELDWYEETFTWCDKCGAEWEYPDDTESPMPDSADSEKAESRGEVDVAGTFSSADEAKRQAEEV